MNSQDILRPFEETARDFSRLVENVDGFSPEAFVDEALRLLLHLYARAAAIPDLEPGTDEDVPSGPKEAAISVAQSISAKLGELDVYALVFDPYEDTDIVMSSLGSDLSEIYYDLSGGLRIFGGDGLRDRDVAWEWRFGFTTHWGRHLVSALTALHAIKSNYLLATGNGERVEQSPSGNGA
jgi:hypothetical protein